MSDAPLDRPRALQRDDRREAFDRGSEPLNDYLQRFAWTNQQAESAPTSPATRIRSDSTFLGPAPANRLHAPTAPHTCRPESFLP